MPLGSLTWNCLSVAWPRVHQSCASNRRALKPARIPRPASSWLFLDRQTAAANPATRLKAPCCVGGWPKAMPKIPVSRDPAGEPPFQVSSHSRQGLPRLTLHGIRHKSCLVLITGSTAALCRSILGLQSGLSGMTVDSF